MCAEQQVSNLLKGACEPSGESLLPCFYAVRLFNWPHFFFFLDVMKIGTAENRYRWNSSEARPTFVARLLIGLGSISQ